MSRQYRICYRKSSPLPGYQIHEVYYDDDGNIKHYSKQPITPYGDIKEELYHDMCDMMDAFDREYLNLDQVDFLMKRERKKSK